MVPKIRTFILQNSEIPVSPERLIALIVLLSIMLTSCKKNNYAQQEPDTNDEIVSRVPDTGQTTSYTLTKGEDADFNINPPSYTDNENGTITDNVTGLIWQKTDGGEMTFENASAYCLSLNLGGYSDCRLPTCVELYSINRYDKVNPAMNTLYFTKAA
jgi:hypothetical protein